MKNQHSMPVFHALHIPSHSNKKDLSACVCVYITKILGNKNISIISGEPRIFHSKDPRRNINSLHAKEKYTTKFGIELKNK